MCRAHIGPKPIHYPKLEKKNSTFFHAKTIMWVSNGNVPKQNNGGHLHQCGQILEIISIS
jgi:hypothetical protein